MRILAVLAVSFMTLVSFASGSALAQEDNQQFMNQQLLKEIKSLKDQIERLEERSRTMNMKIYDAEAKDAKAWYNKIKVKTKKGTGLTFRTADGNYKLRTRLRGQFLAQYTNPEGEDNNEFGFRVRRLRVTWDGNAFEKWMKYKVQYDFSRGGALNDMKLSFAKNKAAVPTVGQYKVPFNMEVMNSSSALQLVGRSVVTDYFEYGRDIGVGLGGLLGDGMVRYDLGIFQGDGVNVGVDKDDSVLWAGRVQAAFLGGNAKKVRENFAKKPALMAGVAVAGINVGFDGENAEEGNTGALSEARDIASEVQVTSLTADLNYRDPRFNLTGEYIGRWANPDGDADTAYDYGFRVQGGFFVMPKKFELASRYARVEFDDAEGFPANLDNVWTFTQGVNYYLSGNHKWKIQFDYTFQREEDTGGEETDENMLRAQVQAYF